MSASKTKVVIVGGGVAALEAALAIHHLAADKIDLTILAPNEKFLYRPMTVQEPLAMAEAETILLADFAADVEAHLIVEEMDWLDRDKQTVHATGDLEIPYDALILALGAKAHPRYNHALTIDDHNMDETFHGLVQDVEEGYAKSLAFVAPPCRSWPLPLYELALMISERAKDMSEDLKMFLITPESGPLDIFGSTVSEAVAELLEEADIQLIHSAHVEVPKNGQVVIHPSDKRLTVDRIIALPELYGPKVRGLPLAERGFIRVDSFCQVPKAGSVYAVGDSTNFPVKHGGLATQQADVAANGVAILAGCDIEPERYCPVVHGMLLTGGKPKYLTANLFGGQGFRSEISDEPTWSPPHKIASRYLAPYMESKKLHGGSK